MYSGPVPIQRQQSNLIFKIPYDSNPFAFHSQFDCFWFLQVALRWRIEREVITGKGQFICGNKYCDTRTELRSWEVNFAYAEQGEKKNALVKLSMDFQI